jgi:hypothetical protein
MSATRFSSPQRRSNRHHARRRGLTLVGGLVLGAVALTACTTAAPPAATPVKHTHTTIAAAAAATAALCPLTGAPVPSGGQVPARTALAVKVDNYPDARPQSGLDKADIIFEEPVEGGITRYVAVFQCQQSDLVGPIRSARNIDIGILGQLGSPLLAHVGGITPVLANITNSPLVNVDLGINWGAAQHPAGRYAPYDTYAATADLWNMGLGSKEPPAPLFTYSNVTPFAPEVSSIAIPYSGTSNVVWRYVPQIHAWQRFYGLAPDMLADNLQNTAANVVVQHVSVSYGPWAENDQGGMEVQANLYGGVSGKAEVFRSGVEVEGTWQRAGLDAPTQFLDSNGQPIAMQPGQTWVELVPDGITVTATQPNGTLINSAG